MSRVYGEVLLVAGGLWAVACVALLIAWRVSKQRDRSPSGRGALIAVADEFLMVSRQAERSASSGVQDRSGESESRATAEEFAKYHKQAAILFELLRAYLAEDSPSLRHAEAILVDITGLGGSGFDHRMVEHRSSLVFHRTMFASVIWEDADYATLKRSATPAPAVVRQPHNAGHRRLRHR
jgi:hypothetical protein